VGSFIYGRRYLERPDVTPLDPYHFPLTASEVALTALPSVLQDAGPDSWGRRLIDWLWGRTDRDPDEADYLMAPCGDGVGHFCLSDTMSLPSPSYLALSDLPQVTQAIQQLLADVPTPEEINSHLVATGLGGAQPKVSILDRQMIWLAKLPRTVGDETPRIEYATLELARAAGIEVPAGQLVETAYGPVLMTSRFDRDIEAPGQEVRHDYRSALTALNADTSPATRKRWSYLELAHELTRRVQDPKGARRELYRRMVFNALIGNGDDHPKNHGILCRAGVTSLSPAFDLLPQHPVSGPRHLALTAGVFGTLASRENLLSGTGHFGLNASEALAIIGQVQSALALWRPLYEHARVSGKALEVLARTFCREHFTSHTDQSHERRV
jgi:serine/threonine-protein kinase HipA